MEFQAPEKWQRYFLEITFDGSRYSGWQIQNNAITVQAEITKMLGYLVRTPINVIGCGRTDTGVHAQSFFLHFDCEKELSSPDLKRLNLMLPHDIAVNKIWKVHANAHARFDAIERTYRYKITFEKNPFLKNYAFYIYNGMPDFEKMNEAAKQLLQFDDFASLCRLKHDAKTTICQVKIAEWTKVFEAEWNFTISSNRFLRNMIRLTVGAMLQVGFGKLSLEAFVDTIAAKKRFELLKPAPPNGLSLIQVKYPYIES